MFSRDLSACSTSLRPFLCPRSSPRRLFVVDHDVLSPCLHGFPASPHPHLQQEHDLNLESRTPTT